MAPTAAARYAVLLTLVALTVAVYAPLRRAPYVYEDVAAVMTADTAAAPFTVPSRVLSVWSFRLDRQDPARAHLQSVAWHVANGLLVYAVTAALASPGAAVLAAGVFWLHPLNSEAVSYVSRRSDLLMTTFVLLALLAALRAGAWSLPLVLVALLLAAASKEIGVVGAALVWLTLDRWRGRTWATLAVGSLVVIQAGAVMGSNWSAIVGWFAMHASAGGTALTWPAYLLLQATALWRLLALAVWPVGLSVDHDIIGLAFGWRVAAVALTGFALTALVATWHRAPLVAWAFAWVPLALAPRFVFRTNEFINEHHMYLPMAGLSIAAGCALWAWVTAPRLETEDGAFWTLFRSRAREV